MEPAPRALRTGALLRVGLFALLAVIALVVFGTAFSILDSLLLSATLATFAAGLTASHLAVRVYGHGSLAEAGLTAAPDSLRRLQLGILGGAGAAALILGGPLLTGLAHLHPAPEQPANAMSTVFVLVLLFLGALGEELLFRGYAFQVLRRAFGPWLAVAVTSCLFALLHRGNPNATVLSVLITLSWGALLGYACVRGGDLWLPTGLHFGWNAALPLFGVNLSGFTMGTTGYALRWRLGDLWSGGAYGPEGGLLALLVLPLVVVYLHRLPAQRMTTPPLPALLDE